MDNNPHSKKLLCTVRIAVAKIACSASYSPKIKQNNARSLADILYVPLVTTHTDATVALGFGLFR